MARTGVDVTIAARIAVVADGWQAAIRAAGRPLIEAGAVAPGYVDSCVAALVAHGPYVVLAPGVALAHARPEDGVETLGLAVAVLERAVAFGHPANDPVDLVFVFGSPDRERHVGLLSGLARQLQNGLADDLRAAASDAAAASRLREVVSHVD